MGKKNSAVEKAVAEERPNKTGRSSKVKKGSSGCSEIQRAIRRATPPVHIWMSHITDDGANTPSSSSREQNRGRGATKANARAKEDSTLGNTSFQVRRSSCDCAQFLPQAKPTPPFPNPLFSGVCSELL